MNDICRCAITGGRILHAQAIHHPEHIQLFPLFLTYGVGMNMEKHVDFVIFLSFGLEYNPDLHISIIILENAVGCKMNQRGERKSDGWGG